MGDNDAPERLIGRWGLFMSYEQPIPDGVFTMTLTEDGRMVSVIQDGEEVTTLNYVYSLSGDEIITLGPKEYSTPNETHSKFCFDEAGNLIFINGVVKNRFKRV